MNSRGPVVDTVVIEKNALTFSYITEVESKEEIEAELLLLRKYILDIRKFRAVTITASKGRNKITKVWQRN
jgi:hypothetical protein